ncbi:hypothetical protein T492DRAFT_901675 [Pavlovales sp. CCMP2436]|nr:hypothetical protein T492DRAFT_901675 [Pavlovales sp. CCMP2436]
MLRGVVKQVLSGDTIVIMGLDSSRGPPPEKQLTLANLQAPRLSNRNNPVEQPFAWASRESLRAQLIGKEVSFSIDYANTAARQFGTVITNDGQSVALAIVAAGWARVQAPKPADGAPTASASPALEQLKEAEAAAKEHGLGQWTSEEGAATRSTRIVDYAPDVAALLKEFKGQRVSAVVEHVNSASSYRLTLLPGFQSISMMLVGVMTPVVKRDHATGTEEAAPLAREAKFFAESRVMHRTVRVVLEGIDKSGNLVGSVLHVVNEINMGAELLKVGLGKVADWSLSMTSSSATLRQAEAQGRNGRLNLWKGYTPPAAREGMSEYQARVVEVVGADVLIVHDGVSERRICLSAVKVPRAGFERRCDAGEPWAYEAKEWTRRAAIGKKVRVVPEFTRRLEARDAVAAGEGISAQGAKPEVERTYCAVFLGDRNLAAGLIGAGLALVNTQSRGDEISAHVDVLLDAERAAKERKGGMHGNKAPTGQPWNAGTDLTLPVNKARAQAFLASLQRDTKVRATVLHIVHGARYKCLVGREGIVISFALVGVRCPATARRDQPNSVSEPFADEAFELAKATLLQREVELEVETLDKNGVFMGTVHAPESKSPFSITLLEAGLASRIPPAADRSRHGIALEAAERSAREQRLKVWQGYAEAVEPEAEEEEEVVPADGAAEALRAALARLPEMDLNGTDVSDGVTFYAQPTSAATAGEAKRIEEALKGAGAIVAPTLTLKTGNACAARFSGDGSFYRAKVTAVLPGGQVELLFVDYGNSQTCALSECRPLDPSISLTATPPLALLCKLAYLVAPSVDDDAGRECAQALSELVLGRPVRARVERRAGHELAVTLLLGAPEGASGSGSSAPAEGDGPAAAKPSPLAGSLNAELVQLGMGMWCFGDIEEDDCKEFGWTPNAPPAWGKK